MVMRAFFAEEERLHDARMFLAKGALRQNPERPERVLHLTNGAMSAGCALERPSPAGLGAIAAVHTVEYLDFLSTIHTQWRAMDGAADEVLPNIHPGRHGASYPKSPIGRAGYHMADTSCAIMASTWESVRWSAWTAIAATECVLAGEKQAYALCRPPGHHAFSDMAGGFSYLNCTAIAAQMLRSRHRRVAIVDVDVHHGNGTQGIFYDRPDVFTISLHADPSSFYPFFWGHAEERGTGHGLGYNLNLPLPLGTEDEGYLAALDQGLRQLELFAPDAIVVALGLDAYAGDPFAGLAVSTAGFGKIAERLSKLSLPTVLVQEGGYICDDLGANLTSFLTAFAKDR